jgi:hypothetical protein
LDFSYIRNGRHGGLSIYDWGNNKKTGPEGPAGKVVGRSYDVPGREVAGVAASDRLVHTPVGAPTAMESPTRTESAGPAMGHHLLEFGILVGGQHGFEVIVTASHKLL